MSRFLSAMPYTVNIQYIVGEPLDFDVVSDDVVVSTATLTSVIDLPDGGSSAFVESPVTGGVKLTAPVLPTGRYRYYVTVAGTSVISGLISVKPLGSGGNRTTPGTRYTIRMTDDTFNIVAGGGGGSSVPSALGFDAGGNASAARPDVPSSTIVMWTNVPSEPVNLGPFDIWEDPSAGGTVDTIARADAAEAQATAESAASLAEDLVFNVRSYGAVGNGVTDDTDAVIATIAAAAAVEGAEVYFPPGNWLITDQIVLPNTPNGTFAAKQRTLRFSGGGSFASGQNEVRLGASTLLLTYQGDGSPGDAQIVTYGLGLLEASGLTFRDTNVGADTPFIYTTNTTLRIHDSAFLGADAGAACQKDAIVLGGTTKPITEGYQLPDAPFQGYGTVIRENYFNRVRRAVYGRSYCNQVQIVFNMMDKGCGTNLVDGVCIEIDGSLSDDHAGDYCTNNVILGNYLHFVGGYTYCIRLKKCVSHFVAGNGFIDFGDNDVAGVVCEGHTIAAVDYPSFDNVFIGNVCTHQARILVEDALSDGRNTLLGGAANDVAEFVLGAGKSLKLSREARLRIDVPVPSVSNFGIATDADEVVLSYGPGAGGTWLMRGPLNLVGHTDTPTATTRVVIGNHVTNDDAVLKLDAPSGKQNQITTSRNNVASWLFYDANSTSWFMRDVINGVMHVTLVPGSATTGRVDFGVPVTAPAAGGYRHGTAGPFWRSGAGSPEGVLTAPVGSLWSRTDGAAATTLYVKETGAGNTGWVAK